MLPFLKQMKMLKKGMDIELIKEMTDFSMEKLIR